MHHPRKGTLADEGREGGLEAKPLLTNRPGLPHILLLPQMGLTGTYLLGHQQPALDQLVQDILAVAKGRLAGLKEMRGMSPNRKQPGPPKRPSETTGMGCNPSAPVLHPSPAPLPPTCNARSLCCLGTATGGQHPHTQQEPAGSWGGPGVLKGCYLEQEEVPGQKLDQHQSLLLQLLLTQDDVGRQGSGPQERQHLHKEGIDGAGCRGPERLRALMTPWAQAGGPFLACLSA